jgi:serine/threonine protein kinase
MTLDAQGNAGFSEQFAALEEAILSGQTPPAIADETPPEDQQRLREAGAILQLLELDRRISSHLSPQGSPTPGLDYVPQRLGGFQLERELGRGGYGIVYLARDPRLKRLVALKTPLPNALLSLDLRRRFLREARAAADLDHPHLIPIYEVGEEGPHCFLVSRYCPAGSLADFLRNAKGPVPLRAAVELVAKIADAVGYMHGRGLLHRDIKPSNILLEGRANREVAPGDGRVDELATMHPRLSDFGLVKAFGAAEQAALSASLGGNGMLGTPAYMAPEQAQNSGKEVGPPADVYSLGALLYELLTGQPPFSGSNIVEILEKVISHEPAPLRSQRPEIKRDLETICLKCLAKRPEDRYFRADQLTADLRRFLAGEPVLGRRPNILRRTWRAMRRKPLVPVAAGLGIALVFISTFFLVQKSVNDRAETRRRRLAEYTNLIAQASESLRNGKLAEVPEFLNKLRPKKGEEDLRGFEWFYLWQEMWNAGPRWRVGSYGAEAIAFSPNGKRIAVGLKNSIAILNTTTGELINTLLGQDEGFNLLDYSTDGSRVLSVSTPRVQTSICLWDTASGTRICSWNLPSPITHDAKFSRDNKSLLIAHQNRILRINPLLNQEPTILLTQALNMEDAAKTCISPDSTLVAAAFHVARRIRWAQLLTAAQRMLSLLV